LQNGAVVSSTPYSPNSFTGITAGNLSLDQAEAAGASDSYGNNVGESYVNAQDKASAGGTNGAYTDPSAGIGGALAVMTPAQFANYAQQLQSNNEMGGVGAFLQRWVPVALTAVAAGETGGVVGPALGGGLGGALGGGAAAGAVGTETSSLENNLALANSGSLAKGIGTGALVGGLGYAAQPATGAIANAGVNPTLANAAVKGTIGAGVGALGGALSGSGAEIGAIVGGVGGAASGALGASTGSQGAGMAGGILGAALAGKYLTSTPKPAAPAAVAPTPSPSRVTPASSSPATPQPTAAPAPSTPAATTNIGPYSGFSGTGLGYQPMTQVNAGITKYNTYGQGPQASFFAPTPGTT
jgi:hypothetical protein